MSWTIRESQLLARLHAQHSTGVDTNAITTRRNHAPRTRHYYGTTHPRRAVNSVTDKHALRRCPEARHSSEVGACAALRTRHDGAQSTPKPCINHRTCSALGHRHGRRYEDSILDALGTSAAHLWGSGGLLFVQHLFSSVRRQAHGARRPRSFRPRLMACGRRVQSVCNIRWRWGGQRTLPVHPPALSKSRCGHRSTAGRLAADLHQFVDVGAVRPLARCN